VTDRRFPREGSVLQMPSAIKSALEEARERRKELTLERRYISGVAAGLRAQACAMRDSAETLRVRSESLMVEQRILSEHAAWCRDARGEA
jgi:hypothetical protein